MDTTTSKMNLFIATNLRRFRERHAWTQAQLAQATTLSERTIQRAEDGESLSAETLLALAGALNVSLDDLRNQPPAASPELATTHQMIRIVRVERGSDLRPFMPVDAAQFGYEGLNDQQEDAIAEFQQALKDWNDIWRELEPL